MALLGIAVNRERDRCNCSPVAPMGRSSGAGHSPQGWRIVSSLDCGMYEKARVLNWKRSDPPQCAGFLRGKGDYIQRLGARRLRCGSDAGWAVTVECVPLARGRTD